MADDLRREPVADPSDARRRWARGMTIGLPLLVVFVALLAHHAFHGHRFRALAAAAAMTVTVVLLTHVMKRARVTESTTEARRRRRNWILVQLAVGAVLLAHWGGEGARTGRGFTGLVLTFLAVAWGVAELRESGWPGPARGWVLLIATVAGVTGALWIDATGSPVRALAVVGLALMAGQLGIVLASHRLLRANGEARSAPPRWWLPSGLILLGAGTAAHVAWLGPFYAPLLVVGIVVLMVFTTSRGEWDSLFIVGAFVVVWALSPRSEPLPAHLGPALDGDVIVALGDSYLSGEGADVFFDGTNDEGGNECRRSPTAWPVRLAGNGDDTLPDRLVFLACSGARAREIWAEDQDAQGSDARAWQDEGRGQLAQLRHEHPDLGPERIAFVVVSIGGNDAGFSEIGEACIGPGDCTEIAQRWLDGLGRVEQRIVEAHAAIRAELGPDTPVIAVPYPSPATVDGCAASLLSEREHRFVAGFVAQLNAVVTSAAHTAGAHVIDTMPTAIDGARICEKVPPDVNFIAPSQVSGSLEDALNPVNWLHNSLHPNGDGHARMAAAARRWFRDWPATPLPATVDPDGPHPVPDLETVMADPDLRHCGSEDPPPECELATEPRRWLLVQLVRLARLTEPLVAATFVGAWLVSLHAVQRMEIRAIARARRDPDGRKGFAPSIIEAGLYRVMRLTLLDRLVGGIDPREDRRR